MLLVIRLVVITLGGLGGRSCLDGIAFWSLSKDGFLLRELRLVRGGGEISKLSSDICPSLKENGPIILSEKKHLPNGYVLPILNSSETTAEFMYHV